MTSFLRLSFLLLALLLASSVSHGAYVQMAGIVLLCAYCLCLPDIRMEFLKRSNVLRVVSALIVVTLFFLYFLFFPPLNGAPELEKSAFNNYLFLILIALFIMCLAALITRRLGEFSFALATLMVINDLILLMQTVCLVVTNTYIDFVEPITGEASRFHNYENLNPVFAFRPTGLYVEPSTFSAAVGAMAIGYVLLCRARGRQANPWALLLTIVAMLITQSTAATVQCLVLMFAVLLMQKKSVQIWGAVLCGVFVLAAPAFLSAYYGNFMMKMDESSGIRLSLLDYIYHTRNGWDLLFGYGPFTLEESLYHSANPGGEFQVASLNDAGLLHYFVVRFGLIGLAIPAAMFIRMRKDLSSLLFFAVLLSSKLSYAYPVLYVGLLPLLMRLPEWSHRTAVQDDETDNRFEQPMPRTP